MNDDAVAATRAWLERGVIGLNLCPFARVPHAAGRVRIVQSPAASAAELLSDLCDELRALAAADPGETETTLLVHPGTLADFLDHNDFLDVVDAALAELELEGEIQVVAFHPDFRFEGAAPDDPGNLTNRSPHPMLQLLREASVERALEAGADADAIIERNLATLRRLGLEGWRAVLAGGATHGG